MDGYEQPVPEKHALDGGYQNAVMQDIHPGNSGVSDNRLAQYRTTENACPVLGISPD